jgi:hypothetical protein
LRIQRTEENTTTPLIVVLVVLEARGIAVESKSLLAYLR